jgi:acetylglutamate kinase
MKRLKVIKIGGNVIDDKDALKAFLRDFSNLKEPKILVHGGGKLATRLAAKLEIPVKMEGGRRITDRDTLEIITMVYAGDINKKIIAQLQANNCNAIGFTGADGNTISSKKRSTSPIDFGYVGDIEQVNTGVLQTLLNQNITPVFCAITHDSQGQLLNTNADTIASALSIGFAKDYRVELSYCFEKKGVLENIDDESSLVKNINSSTYQYLINTGVISDGMLPKLKSSFHALEHNVEKVCIGKHEMIFKENSDYTTITK